MARITHRLMEIGRRLGMLLGLGKFNGELDEELLLHRELKEQELKNKGVPAEEAHYTAMRDIGNALQLRSIRNPMRNPKTMITCLCTSSGRRE